MENSNRQHERFQLKPIEFAIGDEASMKNRYAYKDWSIEPFILQNKQVVTEDDKPNYHFVELKQTIKHKGYCYVVRIFTEQKRHQVQLFTFMLGNYAQAEMFGDFIEVTSIYEARAIAFNWYLMHIGKRKQITEGFLVESEERHSAKQTIHKAEPWSFRWMTRRLVFVFFALVFFVEFAKQQPIVAATLGGYTGASIVILVLFTIGIARLQKLFRHEQPEAFEEEEPEEDPETVTFKKKVAAS